MQKKRVLSLCSIILATTLFLSSCTITRRQPSTSDTTTSSEIISVSEETTSEKQSEQISSGEVSSEQVISEISQEVVSSDVVSEQISEEISSEIISSETSIEIISSETSQEIISSEDTSEIISSESSIEVISSESSSSEVISSSEEIISSEEEHTAIISSSESTISSSEEHESISSEVIEDNYITYELLPGNINVSNKKVIALIFDGQKELLDGVLAEYKDNSLRVTVIENENYKYLVIGILKDGINEFQSEDDLELVSEYIPLTGAVELGEVPWIIVIPGQGEIKVNGVTKEIQKSTEEPGIEIQYSLKINLNKNDVVTFFIDDQEVKLLQNATYQNGYIAPRDGQYTFYLKYNEFISSIEEIVTRVWIEEPILNFYILIDEANKGELEKDTSVDYEQVKITLNLELGDKVAITNDIDTYARIDGQDKDYVAPRDGQYTFYLRLDTKKLYVSEPAIQYKLIIGEETYYLVINDQFDGIEYKYENISMTKGQGYKLVIDSLEITTNRNTEMVNEVAPRDGKYSFYYQVQGANENYNNTLWISVPAPLYEAKVKDNLVALNEDVKYDLEIGDEVVLYKDKEATSQKIVVEENGKYLIKYIEGQLVIENTNGTASVSFVLDNEKYGEDIQVRIGNLINALKEVEVSEDKYFSGWYLDEELIQKYYNNTAVTESFTLYGKTYDRYIFNNQKMIKDDYQYTALKVYLEKNTEIVVYDASNPIKKVQIKTGEDSYSMLDSYKVPHDGYYDIYYKYNDEIKYSYVCETPFSFTYQINNEEVQTITSSARIELKIDDVVKVYCDNKLIGQEKVLSGGEYTLTIHSHQEVFSYSLELYDTNVEVVLTNTSTLVNDYDVFVFVWGDDYSSNNWLKATLDGTNIKFTTTNGMVGCRVILFDKEETDHSWSSNIRYSTNNIDITSFEGSVIRFNEGNKKLIHVTLDGQNKIIEETNDKFVLSPLNDKDKENLHFEGYKVNGIIKEGFVDGDVITSSFIQKYFIKIGNTTPEFTVLDDLTYKVEGAELEKGVVVEVYDYNNQKYRFRSTSLGNDSELLAYSTIRRGSYSFYFNTTGDNQYTVWVSEPTQIDYRFKINNQGELLEFGFNYQLNKDDVINLYVDEIISEQNYVINEASTYNVDYKDNNLVVEDVATFHSITYHYNIDDVANKLVNLRETEKVELEELAKNSYSFKGWYEDEEFKILFSSEYLTKDVNLYAKWVKTYSLIDGTIFVEEGRDAQERIQYHLEIVLEKGNQTPAIYFEEDYTKAVEFEIEEGCAYTGSAVRNGKYSFFLKNDGSMWVNIPDMTPGYKVKNGESLTKMEDKNEYYIVLELTKGQAYPVFVNGDGDAIDFEIENEEKERAPRSGEYTFYVKEDTKTIYIQEAELCYYYLINNKAQEDNYLSYNKETNEYICMISLKKGDVISIHDNEGLFEIYEQDIFSNLNKPTAIKDGQYALVVKLVNDERKIWITYPEGMYYSVNNIVDLIELGANPDNTKEYYLVLENQTKGTHIHIYDRYGIEIDNYEYIGDYNVESGTYRRGTYKFYINPEQEKIYVVAPEVEHYYTINDGEETSFHDELLWLDKDDVIKYYIDEVKVDEKTISTHGKYQISKENSKLVITDETGSYNIKVYNQEELLISTSIKENEKYNEPTLDTSITDNYELIGYFTDIDFTKAYDFNQLVTKDLDLYVKLEAKAILSVNDDEYVLTKANDEFVKVNIEVNKDDVLKIKTYNKDTGEYDLFVGDFESKNLSQKGQYQVLEDSKISIYYKGDSTWVETPTLIKNKIYVSLNWDELYMFSFIDGDHHNASWPGEKISSKEGTYYVVEIEEKYTYFILNNGEDSQTVDVLNTKANNNKSFVLGDKENDKYTLVVEGTEDVKSSLSEYYYIINNEHNPAAWVWNNAEDGAFIVFEEVEDQDGLYRYRFTKEYSRIIIGYIPEEGEVSWDNFEKLSGDLRFVENCTFYNDGFKKAKGSIKINNENPQEALFEIDELGRLQYTFENIDLKKDDVIKFYFGEDQIVLLEGEFLRIEDALEGYVAPRDGKYSFYIKEDSVWINYPQDENSITLYFTNSKSWENIYVYAWNEDIHQENASWPGVKMVFAYKNEYEQDVYRIVVDSSLEGILFHNGNGDQTEDGVINYYDHNAYYVGDKVGDKYYIGTWDTRPLYEISFCNDDDSVLLKLNVREGQIPQGYETLKPEKDSNAQYNYIFKSWDKEIEKATKDASYKALYESEVRSYNVSFIDDDNKELKKETVEYNKLPTPPSVNNKEDDKYIYTFTGWDKKISAVTKDTIYQATYNKTAKQFNLKFVIDEEEISSSVAYDSNIVYPENPTKTGYHFVSWDKDLTKMPAEDTVITALFEINKYQVTISVLGMNIEGSTEIEHGSNLVVTLTLQEGYEVKDQVKTDKGSLVENSNNYTLTLENITEAQIINITGIKLKDVYVSISLPTSNKLNFVGEASLIQGHNYQLTISYKEGYEGSYILYVNGVVKEVNNNSVTIENVTENLVITVDDTNVSLKQFAITFVIDGKEEKVNYHYGETVSHTNPTKASNYLTNYAFDGWDKDFEIVTKAETYTAVFVETPNIYTLGEETFVDVTDEKQDDDNWIKQYKLVTSLVKDDVVTILKNNQQITVIPNEGDNNVDNELKVLCDFTNKAIYLKVVEVEETYRYELWVEGYVEPAPIYSYIVNEESPVIALEKDYNEEKKEYHIVGIELAKGDIVSFKKNSDNLAIENAEMGFEYSAPRAGIYEFYIKENQVWIAEPAAIATYQIGSSSRVVVILDPENNNQYKVTGVHLEKDDVVVFRIDEDVKPIENKDYPGDSFTAPWEGSYDFYIKADQVWINLPAEPTKVATYQIGENERVVVAIDPLDNSQYKIEGVELTKGDVVVFRINDEIQPIKTEGYQGNSLTAPWAGEYNFYIKQGEVWIVVPADPTVVTVYKLVGIGGDWGYGSANEGANVVDVNYKLKTKFTLDISSEEQFKITDGGSLWYGYEKIESGSAGTEASGGNIILAPGKYEVYFKIDLDDKPIIQVVAIEIYEPEVQPALTHFEISSDVGMGNAVYLLGDFNGWSVGNDLSLTRMEYQNGKWVKDLDLSPGEYYYKFVVANWDTGAIVSDGWTRLNSNNRWIQVSA